MKTLLLLILFAVSLCAAPINSGDPDGSGMVTINDVVYLIQYIFNGGPDPVALECPELLEGVYYNDTDWIEWYAGSVTFTRADNVVKRVYTVDATGKPTWYYLVPDTSDWWDSGVWGDSLVMSAGFSQRIRLDYVDTTAIDWSLWHKAFLYDLWVSGGISYREYLDGRLERR